jgi:rRNA (uridine-N3-)-methyltransferase BTM5-like
MDTKLNTHIACTNKRTATSNITPLDTHIDKRSRIEIRDNGIEQTKRKPRMDHTTTTTTTKTCNTREKHAKKVRKRRQRIGTSGGERKVLIVGDGNLSFSRAFARRFVCDLRLLFATTFDSYLVLKDKYSLELDGIIRTLSTIRATILHGVDATNLSETLHHAVATEEEAAAADMKSSAASVSGSASASVSGSGSASASVSASASASASVSVSGSASASASVSVSGSGSGSAASRIHVDCIIFNFPHLGVEDLWRHQLLLAHYFAEANVLLSEVITTATTLSSSTTAIAADSIPQVWVTLADDQPENWRVLDQAKRCGLRLFDCVPFIEKEWPGYERKRHHCGKSFPLKRARTYKFARAEHVSDDTYAQAVHKHHTVGVLPVIDCPHCDRQSFKSDNALAKHVRSKHADVTTTDTIVNETIECKEIVADAMTHTGSGGDTTGSRCIHCSRVFPNAEGLSQHERSRHALMPVSLQMEMADAHAVPHNTVFITESDEKLAKALADAGTNADMSSLNLCEILFGPVPDKYRLHSTEAEAVSVQPGIQAKCLVCGVEFVSREALAIHKSAMIPVNVAKPLACNHCTNTGRRTYKDERALRQHMVYAHWDDLTDKQRQLYSINKKS